jgi:uncharacterized protein (DUF2147 family)
MRNLKKILLVTVVLISFTAAKAQVSKNDAILGQWWDETKYVKIEIYKNNNKYYGKLVWGKDMFDKAGKSNKDIKNPDSQKKKRDLYNLIMLTDFVYKDQQWDDGEIYDATKGKTYSATMQLDKDKLIIRGYIGISLLGRNTTWERAK